MHIYCWQVQIVVLDMHIEQFNYVGGLLHGKDLKIAHLLDSMFRISPLLLHGDEPLTNSVPTRKDAPIGPATQDTR